MELLEVKYNSEEETYYVTEKYDGQTYEMGLQRLDDTSDTNWWNLYIAVYNKRKHTGIAEDKILLTGKHPFHTIGFAARAMKSLERELVEWHHSSIHNVIVVMWLDNKRRDAYEHFLTRKGYSWGAYERKKVLMKRVN